MPPGGFGPCGQPEAARLDDQVGVGRDDVDVVGHDGRLVDHLGDRHVRLAPQQLGEQARVLRVEMLDQDVRHAGVAGQVLEELGEGFEATSRGTDADDRAHAQTPSRGRRSP